MPAPQPNGRESPARDSRAEQNHQISFFIERGAQRIERSLRIAADAAFARRPQLAPQDFAERLVIPAAQSARARAILESAGVKL